jgi:hypothetical protein
LTVASECCLARMFHPGRNFVSRYWPTFSCIAVSIDEDRRVGERVAFSNDAGS